MNITNLKHSPRPSTIKKESQKLVRSNLLRIDSSRNRDVSFKGELLEGEKTSFLKIKKERGPSLKFLTGGEQGGLLLNATFLLFIVTLIATLSLKGFLLKDEESHQRKTTYLCLKSTLDLWSNHQRFIKHTNMTIIAIQAALAIKPNPALLKLKRVTQKWQELKNVNRWRRALSNRNCSGLQLAFVKKTFPLEHRGVKLKRNMIGTVSLKKSSTSFYLPSKSRFPFFFFIRGEIHFSPNLQLVTSRETSTRLPRALSF